MNISLLLFTMTGMFVAKVSHKSETLLRKFFAFRTLKLFVLNYGWEKMKIINCCFHMWHLFKIVKIHDVVRWQFNLPWCHSTTCAACSFSKWPNVRWRDPRLIWRLAWHRDLKKFTNRMKFSRKSKQHAWNRSFAMLRVLDYYLRFSFILNATELEQLEKE